MIFVVKRDDANMNSHSNSIASLQADSCDLRAARRPVPVWLFVFLFVLLYWAMVTFDTQGGWFNSQVYAPYHSLVELQQFQPQVGPVNLQRGMAVFDNVCGLCHNPDGMGKPNQAPPLAGSEWVQGNPSHMIPIPLIGLSGPISVKGQQWNLAMPAMGANLSDEDLAAVLSYIRQSWGNNGSEITPEQVQKLRAQMTSRTQPLTAVELNSIP